MLGTASDDQTAKLFDFKAGKVLYTGWTSDESKFRYFNINQISSQTLRHGPLSMLYLDEER